MKTVLALAVSALMLSACAWRSVGTPDEGMYAASTDCTKKVMSNDNNGVMLAAFPFGALGGAIAGAAVASQNQPNSLTSEQKDKIVTDCMAAHGWVKN